MAKLFFYISFFSFILSLTVLLLDYPWVAEQIAWITFLGYSLGVLTLAMQGHYNDKLK